jgi:hypothetical protein
LHIAENGDAFCAPRYLITRTADRFVGLRVALAGSDPTSAANGYDTDFFTGWPMRAFPQIGGVAAAGGNGAVPSFFHFQALSLRVVRRESGAARLTDCSLNRPFFVQKKTK